MKQLPKIMCAKCCQEVEQAEWSSHPQSGGYRLKVWCHGDTDETIVSPEMLHAWPDVTIIGITAFVTERIAS